VPGATHAPHHPTPEWIVIDIVPTILEATGITAPVMVNGIAQKPIEGVSMAYSFDQANATAPTPHETQYFEMMADRALYQDGWTASTKSFGRRGRSSGWPATVIATLFLCAVSVSGAIFLILEMYTPFEGVIQISSAPLRNALAHLGQ
jgi:arylsulfatase A-like enzyme